MGSFLNALIYRLPREIPFGLSRSFCPHCKNKIAWYFNLPLVSYLFLFGRCHDCKEKISLRYPLIELLTCILAILIAPKYISLHTVLNFLFLFTIGCAFLVHFFIDLEHQILPNSVNIILALLFLIYALLNFNFLFWFSGFAFGLGFPLLVTWLFYLLRGQIGLGGGDIKLFGILGIYLGPFGVLLNIFLSCFLGSIIGLSLIVFKKMDKNNPLPFGPAIIIVASMQIFFPYQFSQALAFFGLPH